MRQNSPAQKNAGQKKGLECQGFPGIAGAIQVADAGRVRNGELTSSPEGNAEPVRIRASRPETAVARAVEDSVFELAIGGPVTCQEASVASGAAMTEVSRLPRTDSVQNQIARLLVPEPTTVAGPKLII